MKQIDVISSWLDSVALSHSESKATREQYKRVWENFSSCIGKTANEILADYETSEDRIFMRKYAQLIRAWASELITGKATGEPNTSTSVRAKIGTIRSFFHTNDLPLGNTPLPRSGVVFHNRDISREEIMQIMSVSKIREKAFYAVMAQSGLRPFTIAQLQLKHLEPLDKVPCKIDVPREIAKGKYGSYITFIGADAIKYLKQYFATRTNLSSDTLVFCSHDNPNNPINVKDVSRAFRLSARQLEGTGALNYKIREGKPSEIRLYNLRKFFRKFAIQMGFENVEYMMGHSVKGVDGNYRPQDPEYYRPLYADKAMPFLRLETNTPTETEKTIEDLRVQIATFSDRLTEKDKEIAELKNLLLPLVEILKLVPKEGSLNLVVHKSSPEEDIANLQSIEEYEKRSEEESKKSSKTEKLIK